MKTFCCVAHAKTLARRQPNLPPGSVQLPLPLAFFDSQRNPHNALLNNARRTPSSKNALLTAPSSKKAFVKLRRVVDSLVSCSLCQDSSGCHLIGSHLIQASDSLFHQAFLATFLQNISSERFLRTLQNASEHLRTHHNTLHIRSNVLVQYRQPGGCGKSR
jgi:hypothetical protein